MTPPAATTIDAEVESHGTITLITPLTTTARDWLSAHVAGEQLWWGSGLCVEPRLVEPLLDGMRGDGLTVAC